MATTPAPTIMDKVNQAIGPDGVKVDIILDIETILYLAGSIFAAVVLGGCIVAMFSKKINEK